MTTDTKQVELIARIKKRLNKIKALLWRKAEKQIEKEKGGGIAELLDSNIQYGGNKENEKQLAMAKFVIKFKTISEEDCTFEWQGWPLRYLDASQQPHSQTGLQYMKGDKRLFIPWHQIKISSLEETILWDDGGY